MVMVLLYMMASFLLFSEGAFCHSGNVKCLTSKRKIGKEGRSDFAVVSYGKCTLALGGQSGIVVNPNKFTDYYKGGYWTLSILKIELRASHIAVAFHNLIYIVGGLNKNVVSVNTAIKQI